MAPKIAFGALSLPFCHFLVSTEFDRDNTVALLSCVPRTLRAVRWALFAGWDYYTHMHSPSTTDWFALHCHWAEALTSMCKANGGVYVKVPKSEQDLL